jgi:hypothetical protein
VLVGLVAVVGTGVLLALRSGPDSGAAGEAGPQSTLLVHLRDDDSSAASAVLYGTGADGVAVLIPSQLIAEVPGAGQQTLGPVLAMDGGAALSRSAVSDLLGVRVDTQWVLGRQSVAALVDAVGGVVVDVDTDVVRGRTVVVAAGRGRPLTGAQAGALLFDRPAGEDDIQYQPRVQRVLQALFARLPADAALTQLVSALPRADRGDGALLRVLGLVARASEARSLLYQTLPVKPLDTDGVPTYSLDTASVDALVTARLAGAALPGRGQTGKRVLVVNGVGTPGLGQSVRNRIVPAGFTFVGSRNETPFGREKTVVVVFSSEAPTLARAAELARVIGLPAAAVQVSPRSQSIADLMVVVGRDFRT